MKRAPSIRQPDPESGQNPRPDVPREKRMLPLQPLSKFKKVPSVEETENDNEDQPVEQDLQDTNSVTSKGSDRRRSFLTQPSNVSCTERMTIDDWMLLLTFVGLCLMLAFGTLCLSLHGDNKFRLTEFRAFNTAFLLTGCFVLTLQLLVACVTLFQGVTGV